VKCSLEKTLTKHTASFDVYTNILLKLKFASLCKKYEWDLIYDMLNKNSNSAEPAKVCGKQHHSPTIKLRQIA
jgi:hypothetical protein